MIEMIKKIFFVQTKQSDDVADFFLHARAREKKAFFRKVIAKANKDQERYLEIYEKSTAK